MKKRFIFLAILLPIVLLGLFLQLLTGRLQAKPQIIDVSGTIATDTTWTVANSPYIITDTVTVQTGVTLTIEAGVTVMTMEGLDQYLDVQGHLEAVGTAVNPILFTSFNDLPANNWGGIVVSGSANFENVIMRNALTALFVSGSSGEAVSIADSVLEGNIAHPLVVNTDALHRLNMSNVSFSNNITDRVGIQTAGGNLTLAGSPVLEPQPGLEGYEELNAEISTVFSVPDGVTLTLQPGVNLMMLSTVQVAGHISASGTEIEPITWQTVPESDGGVFSIIVLPTGTAVFNHTTLKGNPTLGLAVVDESDAPVIIENSTLEGMGDYPMVIDPPSLHRVQMSNVTFLNNAVNRVMVDAEGGQDALLADVTLTAQQGLEWYEFTDASQTSPPEIVVPDGITLTVEPGVELRFGDGAETLVVNGRLQAIGTPTSPITFTSAADSAPGEWEGIVLQGGSSQLQNIVVKNGRENILVGSLASNSVVQISDSTISNSSLTPLGIQTSSLHQTSLSNVSFANNVDGNNIVLFGEAMLGGDAVLNDQPGLDAYVILDGTLSNWFVIPPTSTLSVNSGVTLKFNEIVADFGLRVAGDLQLMGTALQPVVLTSLADSAPNQWAGVVIENGTAQLNYAEIRYGTYNLMVNNTAVSTPVILQNSQLHSAAMDGLLVLDGTVTAVCSRFTNNNGSGVLVLNSGQPDVLLSSSAFVGNGDAGLTNQNSSEVDARHNWWGTASGPAGIGSGSGDAVTGNVLFDPWLDEDTCTTVPYQLYLPAVTKP